MTLPGDYQLYFEDSSMYYLQQYSLAIKLWNVIKKIACNASTRFGGGLGSLIGRQWNMCW